MVNSSGKVLLNVRNGSIHASKPIHFITTFNQSIMQNDKTVATILAMFCMGKFSVTISLYITFVESNGVTFGKWQIMGLRNLSATLICVFERKGMGL